MLLSENIQFPGFVSFPPDSAVLLRFDSAAALGSGWPLARHSLVRRVALAAVLGRAAAGPSSDLPCPLSAGRMVADRPSLFLFPCLLDLPPVLVRAVVVRLLVCHFSRRDLSPSGLWNPPSDHPWVDPGRSCPGLSDRPLVDPDPSCPDPSCRSLLVHLVHVFIELR